MKRVIKALVNRAPYVEGLNKKVKDLEQQVRNLQKELGKQGSYSAGHYSSPIPSEEDVLVWLNSGKPPQDELLGIKLNAQSQYEVLNEYAHFYKDLQFPEEQTPAHRYYYRNGWFGYADAIFLHCFLRKHLPKRIIEVGSGFSSAVMLDTIDSFFPHKPEITLIEPNPDRLNSLLRDNDRKTTKVINTRVQEAPSDIFLTLQSGDFLFLDSSHVVKCQSDLQILLFEILPRLQSGVHVHFHDIFYPFEYPGDWIMEGRYYNENYFLQAFLSYNCEWEIRFFNSYVDFMFPELIKEKMPLCAQKNPGSNSSHPGGGAGLYIQRKDIALVA
jgi:hypothetical protein